MPAHKRQFFLFFYNYLFLNIIRISPGLPNKDHNWPVLSVPY